MVLCDREFAKKERVYLEPDEDLHRAITADELLKRIYNDIDKKFANRNTDNNHTVAQHL